MRRSLAPSYAGSKHSSVSRAPRRPSPYGLFEVTGIELEYPIVDAGLQPRCLVDKLFRKLGGRPASEVVYPRVGFSNELAAHVVEIKNQTPEADLNRAEQYLVEGLRRVTRILREQFGAGLIPTGMHPFMSPWETTLWARAGREIYQAYARLFDIRQHGWLNVQSCHINLPFGTEQETVLLHNAIACLLPYLPALSASSPIYEGQLGPFTRRRACLHLSLHSFTPTWDGKKRLADIGVLYDSRRRNERGLARGLAAVLRAQELHVRLNYPYRGTSDGFTTHCRRVFLPEKYAGLEIEMNQRCLSNPSGMRGMVARLAHGLERVLVESGFG